MKIGCVPMKSAATGREAGGGPLAIPSIRKPRGRRMGKWLARAKSEISKPGDRPTAVTDERGLSAVMAVAQPSNSEKLADSTGSLEPAQTKSPPPDFDPAHLLPKPWDAIRERIHQGWRAEFSPPDKDGRQAITWIPPDPPESRTQHHTGQVRRCDCQHQQATYHPALVTCRAGRESPAACGAWWKFDPRRCDRFAPIANPSPCETCKNRTP